MFGVLGLAVVQRKLILSFGDGVPVKANGLFLKCQMKHCNLLKG